MPKSKGRLQEAVKSISGLEVYFKTGLGAVKGEYRKRITAKDTRLFMGSLDIDAAKEKVEAEDNRWDYAIEYNGEVFFIEVHSGATSDVSTILHKLEWLKQWLKTEAKAIAELRTKRVTPYYWLLTKSYNIVKSSRENRKLAQSKIKIVTIWNYDRL